MQTPRHNIFISLLFLLTIPPRVHSDEMHCYQHSQFPALFNPIACAFLISRMPAGIGHPIQDPPALLPWLRFMPDNMGRPQNDHFIRVPARLIFEPCEVEIFTHDIATGHPIMASLVDMQAALWKHAQDMLAEIFGMCVSGLIGGYHTRTVQLFTDAPMLFTVKLNSGQYWPGTTHHLVHNGHFWTTQS